MLRPVYFPFTCLTESTADAMFDRFGKIAVVLPSDLHIPDAVKQLSDAGVLEIRIPVEGEEDTIQALLNNFHSWSNRLAGNDIAYLKTQTDRIPFFSDVSVSQIRSDIKRMTAEAPAPSGTDSMLLSYRLFLHFAQQYDIQQHDILEKLSASDRLEKNLFAQLRGESTFEASYRSAGSGAHPDFGQYMTAERIKSWAEVFGQDPQRHSFNLFVTTSEAVLNFLTETNTGLEPVALDIHTDKTDVTRCLEQLAAKGAISPNPGRLSVDETKNLPATGSSAVYIARNVQPEYFIRQWCSCRPLDSLRTSAPDAPAHTVVVLMKSAHRSAPSKVI